MKPDSEQAVVNSALWAAYGDALGFISELADAGTLKWRAGVRRLETTVPWRRRVGGKFGAQIDLPSGAYSDDTQLRLATSRAIRGDGCFDVEAFAKIELPVWRAYALGAGRGSLTAANNLARSNVSWFSNFFEERRASYVNGGGNGAAIRIQPHVWAARNHDLTSDALVNIVRNALVTHGHMRGVAGAFVHALCLSYALRERAVPGPDVWREFAQRVPSIGELIRADEQLGVVWLPTWQELANARIEDALEQAASECIELFRAVGSVSAKSVADQYSDMVMSVGGADPETRGSGVKTAVLAAGLAWCSQDEDPNKAILLSANSLGTDTDSIATMAAAILGACQTDRPAAAVQDHEYIVGESRRLCRLSRGQQEDSFGYPDPLQWTPPRNQVDTVGRVNEAFAVAGLGIASEVDGVFKARSGDALWQWFALDFGQTVAAKRRSNPPSLQQNQIPLPRVQPRKHAERQLSAKKGSRAVSKRIAEQSQLFETEPDRAVARQRTERPNVDKLTDEAIRSGFDSRIIGQHLLQLCEVENGVELCVAYAAIVAKARIARRRK